MKKQPESYLYRCAKCNRLSVDTGEGEREESKCAYCYHEDILLKSNKKNVETLIKDLKEKYHRP